MNMERVRGNLSFNPGCLKIGLMGDGWPGYLDPTSIERNLLAQNILLACYNDRCSAEEISLQMGVAVAYIENELKELCEVGVLTQKGTRYETNIVIFTKDFSAEAEAKTSHLQHKAAEIITQFLDERLNEIKAVGFYTGGDDDGLLRWRITQLIIERAVLGTGENHFDTNFAAAKKFFGHNLLVWGYESPEYGCLHVRNNNADGDQIKFFEFFAASFRERLFDFGHFYKQENRINLFLEIAKGKQNGFTENETVEIAELIKHGFLKKDGNALNLCVPVYTAEQFKRVTSLLEPVTKKIASLTHEMLAISTDILLQHTPASKKKEAREISRLKLYDLAMSRPVEIMRDSGALRRTTENERPAVYVLLK
jgi:hypothetical protein